VLSRVALKEPNIAKEKTPLRVIKKKKEIKRKKGKREKKRKKTNSTMKRAKIKIRATLLLFIGLSQITFSQKKENDIKYFERPEWAGFFTNCKNEKIDTERFPFIKGAADRVKWADIETSPEEYDWSKMDAQIRNAVKGKYYYYFVLWTGPHSPEWIYEQGVPKVAVKGGKGKDFFPYYLDPNYINYFHRFIGKLAEHIASLPEKERNVFAFIQPAFGSTGDKQLYKGTPIDQKYKISAQQYLEFCSGATKRFYEAFDKPEIKHIRFLFNVDNESNPEVLKGTKAAKAGELLYANWLRKNYPIELRKQQFTIAIGYQTNGEIIQDNELRPTFFGLNGKKPEFVRGEFSKFAQGEIFQENPVWNYYWTAISTVDRGLDLWEVDYNIVKTGQYDEGFAFASRYSYYKQPQTSPYAFIALRDVLDSADSVRFPEVKYGKAEQSNAERINKIEAEFNKYGAKVSDLHAATSLSGSNYLYEAKAMNDVGFELIARNYSRFITQINANETSVGLWRVGPENQPYGRYARAFENSNGRNRMYFDLDDNFLSTKAKKPITLKIIYLDKGIGKFSVRYDSLTDHDKTAVTITKANSGNWVSKSITIADGVFANKGPKNSDFSLVNEDNEDDVFHMIEIINSNPKN
jgi:hypothetical protein